MEVRERILQAAVDRLGAVGVDGLTITAVAAGAGVSRPTVYAAFGTREQLASAAVLHAATEALVRITDRAAAARTAADYLVEVLVAATEEFRRSPALVRVASGSEAGLPGFGEPFGPESMARATSFLAPMLALEPELADDLPEIAELSSRLLLSLVMFDSEMSTSAAALRAFLHRRVASLLGSAVCT